MHLFYLEFNVISIKFYMICKLIKKICFKKLIYTITLESHKTSTTDSLKKKVYRKYIFKNKLMYSISQEWLCFSSAFFDIFDVV